MAYFLEKTSANTSAEVDFSSPITFAESGGVGYTGNWEVRFELELTSTGLVFLSDGLGNTNIIFFNGVGIFEVRRDGFSIATLDLPFSAAGRHEYRLIGDSGAGTVELIQSGISCGTIATATLFDVDAIFPLGNADRTAKLYYIDFYNGGVLQHRYDPTATGGTGSVLEDTVSANNGTLTNFPVNDSQWVLYEDYQLEWRLLNDTGNETLITNIGVFEDYDLTGLTSGTDYEFRVKDTSYDPDSDFSTWVSFTTTGVPTPRNLGVTGETDTSLIFTWQKG